MHFGGARSATGSHPCKTVIRKYFRESYRFLRFKRLAYDACLYQCGLNLSDTEPILCELATVQLYIMLRDDVQCHARMRTR